MSSSLDQSSQSPFSPAQGAQGDDQPNATTAQAHKQRPSPGAAPDEHHHHPRDLNSHPNDDAQNAHRASPPAPEAAAGARRRSASTSASGGGEGRDSSSGSGVEYPPQKHAGKAGLGPHYAEQHRATFQDKIQGLKEEIEGHIRHDEKLRQQGHDRITGKLKEKQKKEVEKNDPFHKSENEGQKTTDKPAASPEHENKNREREDKA